MNTPLSLGELDAVAGGAAGASAVEIDGQVVEALPNSMFQVQLDDGRNSKCRLSGRLRMNFIRILSGDRVRVQTDAGNPLHGRIVWRYK